jgi:hypothetical protein
VAAAALADAPVDESRGGRVEAVIEELDGVSRQRTSTGVAYEVNGRVFAVLAGDRLETRLDPVVSKAALRTPDTGASVRGAGWIAFTPASIDRFALDRAGAWVRSAYQRAAG